MKHFMFAAMFSFGILSTSCAQRPTAPAAAQSAFKNKFPSAQKVKWDQEEEGEWEAEFKMNGKEMSANFKADGTWLETETEIQADDLPQAIRTAINSQFVGYKTEEAAMVETPGSATAYEAELEKGDTTIEATFGADGKLLKQKTESEDDEKGEKNEDEH